MVRKTFKHTPKVFWDAWFGPEHMKLSRFMPKTAKVAKIPFLTIFRQFWSHFWRCWGTNGNFGVPAPNFKQLYAPMTLVDLQLGKSKFWSGAYMQLFCIRNNFSKFKAIWYVRFWDIRHLKFLNFTSEYITFDFEASNLIIDHS